MKHDKNIPVPAPEGLEWRIEEIDILLVKSSAVDADGNMFIEEPGFFGTKHVRIDRLHSVEEGSPIVATGIIWSGDSVRKTSKTVLERYLSRNRRQADLAAARRAIANNRKGA